MATPEMLQPAVQLIELERDSQVHRSNKLGIKQDVSSIFGKKYKPKIIIASPSHQAGGSSGANEPRPFACMFCPAAFKNEAALVAHVRVHVNGNAVHGALNGVNGNVAKQVVHSCVYCNRSFKQQTNLEIHMRTYHSYGDASGSQHQTYSSVNQAQAALNASYMSGLALWEYKNLEQQNQQQQSQQQESGEESAAEGGREGQGEGHNVKTEKREEEGEYRAPDGTAVTWEKMSRDLSAYAVERPYTCDYCNKCFKQEAHLKQHVRIHTDDRPYGCTYCGKAFRQKAVLNQHVRLHTGEKPYSCETCGEKFRQMTTLKLHARKHLCEAISSGYPATPGMFGTQYKDIIKLMNRAGPGSENQQAATALSQHIQQMQQQQQVNGNKAAGTGRGRGRPVSAPSDPELYYVERPHACKFCNKCFKQEAHLKLHIRTHSDYRPFGCTYCGKAFRLKAILNQHLRLHTGEKPYACETCGEKFRQMTTLKLHMRKHLAEVALSGGALAAQAQYAEVIGLIQKGREEEEPHVPGGSEGVSAKEIHAYQVERPYRCAYCIKSFKQQAHLKQHMRIHSDEKPYECTYCGRRFRQKAVLNQHVRLHTGFVEIGL
ncbi:hypothetical protein M8J76_014568 [Diaphorina citri]|nr:hypothetical protein M8J76_014568 [Diaphorina citri]